MPTKYTNEEKVERALQQVRSMRGAKPSRDAIVDTLDTLIEMLVTSDWASDDKRVNNETTLREIRHLQLAREFVEESMP